MGRVQRSRASRRRRSFVGLVVAAVAAAGIAVVVAGGRHDTVAVAQCTSTSGSEVYQLDPEQAANAATIGATATRLGLPDHAVTVALATALQESKLRNLSYGDRDSLGLFQQRPSQGWGTAAQVSEPAYAATAFYHALTKLPGWQSMPVADAAQHVQRSADGSAYAAWESEARTFAAALTGEVPAGVTCAGLPVTSPPSVAVVTGAVRAAFGARALSAAVPPSLGWRAATYLVLDAQRYGVATVSFAGQTWTAHHGAWHPDRHAGAQVTFTLVPGGTRQPAARANGCRGCTR